MKSVVAMAALAALVGCATTSSVPAGLEAGKFVTFACADGKSFRARAADDGASVHVRALHGSAELDRKAAGVYEGDGYKLSLDGGGASLMHDGKPQGQNCKVSA